jgi:uncharacterized lipoprotein
MRYLMPLLLLAGCGLNQEYMSQKNKDEMDRYAMNCERLGLSRGSKENADCAVKMYQAERQPR